MPERARCLRKETLRNFQIKMIPSLNYVTLASYVIPPGKLAISAVLQNYK